MANGRVSEMTNGRVGDRLVYLKDDNDTDDNLPLPETVAF